MAPHSSTLAWKIPWMEEPGGLQSMRSLELDTTERLHFPFSLSCIGEGHGNPLQCSCLENPRDGGACWAAVYGVAQSQIRLRQLSICTQIGLSLPSHSINYFNWNYMGHCDYNATQKVVCNSLFTNSETLLCLCFRSHKVSFKMSVPFLYLFSNIAKWFSLKMSMHGKTNTIL